MTSVDLQLDEIEKASAFVDSDVTHLRQKVRSLQNEVSDLKRLLSDAVQEKSELQLQRDELRALVDELSGKSPLTSHQEQDMAERAITDRAKRTMMHLRMERTEEKRRQLQEVVRSQCHAALSAVRSAKQSLSAVRSEVQDQMESMRRLLTTSARTTKALCERVQSKLHRVASGLGENRGGDYISAVTAAVQEQQRNIVLSPDHPVVVRLSAFLDTFDSLIREVNRQWSGMRCFSSGKPPHIDIPRRYIDPTVNLGNYTATTGLMTKYISHSIIMSTLHSDMSLPELESWTMEQVRGAYAAYSRKIESLFGAMSVLRTPVVVKKPSIQVLLRVAASVDVMRDEAVKLQLQYERLSRQHTSRCFSYISKMISIGRKFTLIHEDGVSTGEIDGRDNAQDTQAPDGGRTSGLVGGEDRHNIMSFEGARRSLYLRRRELMREFTKQRVNHIANITCLMDELARSLKEHRLISPDACKAVLCSGVGQTCAGEFEVAESRVSGERNAGGPLPATTGQAATARIQSSLRGPSAVSDKYNVTSHEMLLKPKTVASSEYYFEKRRKVLNTRDGMGERFGNYGGFIPQGSAERRSTLEIVQSMDVLARLSPRKPGNPGFAFERQNPPQARLRHKTGGPQMPESAK